MEVTCALFGPLREITDQKEVHLSLADGTTVAEALETLIDSYPDLHSLIFETEDELGSIIVTVNGRHIQHEDGLETRLADGDDLRLAPPVQGGTSIIVFPGNNRT